MINKTLILYSLLGSILLLFSRFMGKYLFFLSGYLYIFSYLIIITIALILSRKTVVNGWGKFKLGVSVFLGMTMFYVFFIFLIHYWLVYTKY